MGIDVDALLQVDGKNSTSATSTQPKITFEMFKKLDVD